VIEAICARQAPINTLSPGFNRQQAGFNPSPVGFPSKSVGFPLGQQRFIPSKYNLIQRQQDLSWVASPIGHVSRPLRSQ
jgi:hypothetical protein